MNVNTTKSLGKKILTEAEMDALSARCGEKLAGYPKVRVRIPLAPGEGILWSALSTDTILLSSGGYRRAARAGG